MIGFIIPQIVAGNTNVRCLHRKTGSFAKQRLPMGVPSTCTCKPVAQEWSAVCVDWFVYMMTNSCSGLFNIPSIPFQSGVSKAICVKLIAGIWFEGRQSCLMLNTDLWARLWRQSLHQQTSFSTDVRDLFGCLQQHDWGAVKLIVRRTRRELALRCWCEHCHLWPISRFVSD